MLDLIGSKEVTLPHRTESTLKVKGILLFSEYCPEVDSEYHHKLMSTAHDIDKPWLNNDGR